MIIFTKYHDVPGVFCRKIKNKSYDRQKLAPKDFLPSNTSFTTEI